MIGHETITANGSGTPITLVRMTIATPATQTPLAISAQNDTNLYSQSGQLSEMNGASMTPNETMSKGMK